MQSPTRRPTPVTTGEKITVIVETPTLVAVERAEVLVFRDRDSFIYRMRGEIGAGTGSRRYEDEGKTWARGWDDDTKPMLWAAYNLSGDDE